MAVFSAHVAHDLNAKSAELSATRMVQGRWGFILVQTTLSKYFGSQNSEQSVATVHV